jgi:transposase-like protein
MKRTIESSSRRRRSQEEIAELLREYHRSDLTQRAFADSRGLSLASLSLWLRKARERACEGDAAGERSRLVPVRLRATTGARFELALAGGATLSIPADFDEDVLRKLLEILESRC